MRLCTIDGCDRKHSGNGLCSAHYQRARRGKNSGQPIRFNRSNGEAARRDEQGRKVCVECKKWLPVDMFSAHRGTVDRLQVHCRRCFGARHQYLKYGLRAEDVAQMLTAQEYGCAICAKDITARYVVDHDHACCPNNSKSCGKCVRGLLCDACNLGLGSFQDSPRALREAITYLERHAPDAQAGAA